MGAGPQHSPLRLDSERAKTTKATESGCRRMRKEASVKSHQNGDERHSCGFTPTAGVQAAASKKSSIDGNKEHQLLDETTSWSVSFIHLRNLCFSGKHACARLSVGCVQSHVVHLSSCPTAPPLVHGGCGHWSSLTGPSVGPQSPVKSSGHQSETWTLLYEQNRVTATSHSWPRGLWKDSGHLQDPYQRIWLVKSPTMYNASHSCVLPPDSPTHHPPPRPPPTHLQQAQVPG